LLKQTALIELVLDSKRFTFGK